MQHGIPTSLWVLIVQEREQPSGITPSIFPPRPPPLFPFSAIEHLLSELHIDRIVRFAHPFPKLVS